MLKQIFLMIILPLSIGIIGGLFSNAIWEMGITISSFIGVGLTLLSLTSVFYIYENQKRTKRIQTKTHDDSLSIDIRIAQEEVLAQKRDEILNNFRLTGDQKVQLLKETGLTEIQITSIVSKKVGF